MNKAAIFVFVVFVLALLVAVAARSPQDGAPADPGTGVTSNADDAAVRAHVIEFGAKLKNVTLLMPREDVARQMREHYGAYLSPELLAEWQKEPAVALGRSVSSPWPDRIEVTAVSKASDRAFAVEGNVIEVTSAERPLEPAAIYPVSLTVENRDGKWMIAGLSKGAYKETPKRITLEGKGVCLPHRDTSGPQTLECAFGIAVDQSDAFYAIDTRLMSTYPVDFPTGGRIRVEGVLMPPNPENASTWRIYPIDGIIAATTIEKL